MNLTRTEFEQRYAENRLRIALVGMSNIGKSYTGMRLASKYDFKLIEVDKLIMEQLGQDSMADFAAWQGQPYSAGYQAREAKSVALESEATTKAILQSGGNAILDTTGSVIYTKKTVQENLIKNWFIVYISASEQDLNRLQTQYFKHPKPLIWNGHYKCEPGQKPDQAILSSYSNLLNSRVNDYSALADTTISSEFILDTSLPIESIFERLKPSA